jgi:branched-chain amino acid aminotransferase
LGTESRILLALAPFPPIPEAIYEQGVTAVIARKLVRKDPLIKKASFVPERRKVLESNPSAYECLLVNSEGCILEGTTSNFYAVRRGEVWTAGSGVLEGVARRLVLQVVNELAIKLHLEAVNINELLELEEAAISSSSRAIIPVVKIEDCMIGDGRPGPVTKRLLASYNALVIREIRTAI